MASSPSLFFLILQANRKVARRIDGLLKSEGVTAGQQLVLYTLSQHAPCSSAELARHTRVTAQAMGELVRPLEARGLVARSPVESAGRAILLELTTEGWEVYRRCRRIVAQAEREWLAALPESHRERFLRDLQRLRTFDEGGAADA